MEGAVDGADEGGGGVEAFGAGELHAEGGGLGFEVDVDVVEDLDVIAEEADGLEDDGFVAGLGEELEGVRDGGADPGSAGDALRLEGEVPVGVGEAYGAESGGNGEGGLLALDWVGVGLLGGAVVLDAVGGDWAAGLLLRLGRGNAGHDGAAGNGVGGEEDGDAGARYGAGFCPGWPHAFGEGLREEGFVGPAGDEVYGEAVADGGHEGAAIEAGGGAGVLRREAEDACVLHAVSPHLRDDVGDVGMPVAHADVDWPAEEFAEHAALQEGPVGERRAGGQAVIAEARLGFGEANFGVTVLQFFDDFLRHGAAAGDLLQILGHLAEFVGGAVGEQENCGALAGGFSTHLLAGL